jgi:hypothetical protein
MPQRPVKMGNVIAEVKNKGLIKLNCVFLDSKYSFYRINFSFISLSLILLIKIQSSYLGNWLALIPILFYMIFYEFIDLISLEVVKGSKKFSLFSFY